MSQQNLSQVDFSRFVDDYDEWICVVCQYGDSAFDGVRVLHSCGNHEFHPECLAGVSARGDVRCPVCRFPPNARPPPTQFSPAASDSSSTDVLPLAIRRIWPINQTLYGSTIPTAIEFIR